MLSTKLLQNLPFVAGLTAIVATLTASLAPVIAADVKIEIPAIRSIQTNTPGEGKSDQVYLLVTGIAKGEAVAKQLPDGKSFKASPKEQPVDGKSAVTVWEGKLDEGQSVVLTVAAFAGGKITDDQRKAYFEKKAASDKKIEMTKPTDKDSLNKARAMLSKQNVAFYKAIGELFPKQKGDHYVGAFDVFVINIGGTIHKRITPTGLLHGEHYGTGVKQYSKIKYTRENVLTKDENGQFYELQMEPTAENEQGLRVKMTEVEKIEGDRNVTDYLVDVTIKADGKLTTFELAGEHPGPTIVHDYWDWAE
jgi:hypothetical protein